MKIAISWLFFIYFAVLGTERVRSLFPIGDGGLFPTAFDGYVNLMTVLSLLATVVLLIGFNGGFWRSLFGGATPDYRMLVITAGVLLLSGMVHTEHTVAPVQFGAYGALILAMVLQTVLQVRSVGSAASHWFSLAYLVAFSMAIPVVYRSSIPRAGLFHVIEAVDGDRFGGVFYLSDTADFPGRREESAALGAVSCQACRGHRYSPDAQTGNAQYVCSGRRRTCNGAFHHREDPASPASLKRVKTENRAADNPVCGAVFRFGYQNSFPISSLVKVCVLSQKRQLTVRTGGFPSATCSSSIFSSSGLPSVISARATRSRLQVQR